MQGVPCVAAGCYVGSNLFNCGHASCNLCWLHGRGRWGELGLPIAKVFKLHLNQIREEGVHLGLLLLRCQSYSKSIELGQSFPLRSHLVQLCDVIHGARTLVTHFGHATTTLFPQVTMTHTTATSVLTPDVSSVSQELGWTLGALLPSIGALLHSSHNT